MNRYVLRWQYGVYAGETKTHYTYGPPDILREKAKTLAIDRVEEVLKDTRLERTIELPNTED